MKILRRLMRDNINKISLAENSLVVEKVFEEIYLFQLVLCFCLAPSPAARGMLRTGLGWSRVPLLQSSGGRGSCWKQKLCILLISGQESRYVAVTCSLPLFRNVDLAQDRV